MADLTVAENIALVAGFPRNRGAISWKGVREQAHTALHAVGEGIDVDAKLGELTRADQSLVAIGRALSIAAGAIVLDEPTASLPEADVERLFTILDRLKLNGVSVLYVSHRLDEIRRLADRVTILRDGAVIVDTSMSNITDGEIVTSIVGAAISQREHVRSNPTGDTLLSIASARVSPHSNEFAMQVERGEVLGLAGLRGSGQAELGRAIAGIAPLHESHFAMKGLPVKLSSVPDAIRHRIGFATSRREQEGLAMTLTVRENFFLNPSALRPGLRRPLLTAQERRRAEAVAADVKLKPPTPEAVVGTFSGGNQQKVVLGRWLSIDLDLLVLEEPTIGIDVGARAEIYELMRALADDGLSLVVVSSDFEELYLVCDRVLIFDRGAIREELRGEGISVEAITHSASAASGTDGEPS